MTAAPIRQTRRARSTAALVPFLLLAAPQASPEDKPARRPAPIGFEVNQGQTDPAVRFLARNHGMNVFLTSDELILSFTEFDPPLRGRPSPGKDPRDRQHKRGSGEFNVVRMKLKGANVTALAIGKDPLPGKSHYLKGQDPTKWIKDVARYGRVELTGVYAGVDLVLRGESGQLEYDFVVAPGADPGVIDLEFEGAGDVALDAEGQLVLRTKKGQVRHLQPKSHEVVAGSKKPVTSRFVMKGQGRVGFEVGSRDMGRPLVIDPAIIYQTPLGGTLDDQALGVAVDILGNAYTAGCTESTNFPATTGGGLQGSEDAFVAKLDPNGTVVYSTYLGGSGRDCAHGIAVDRSGRPHVAGATGSADFPRVNAAQNEPGGGILDGFVSKLLPDGSGFVYSTYYGFFSWDQLEAIALDRAGKAWVVGNVSTDTPCGPGFNCLDVTYATFSASGMLDGGGGLGDQYNDIAFLNSVAVDGAGNAYVAFNSSTAGEAWVPFVVKFGQESYIKRLTNPSPNGYAQVFGIAVDRTSHVYVTGWILAPTSFTPVNAFQATPPNGIDAFVAKLDPTGTSFVYATYLGGATGEEIGYGIAADGDGNAYVTGYTNSDDFPVSAGTPPFQGEPFRITDAFFVKFDAAGGFKYSTYIGTPNNDVGNGIAVDIYGDVYVAGMMDYLRIIAPDPQTSYSNGFVWKFDGEFLDVPLDCRDGCHDPGAPVNIYTGSMWLDQTDVVLPGVTSLAFTRSYNSVGIRERTDSSFGPGWTHPFERNVTFEAGRLRLRQANGIPMYFTGPVAGRYTASVPATEKSWFENSGTEWIRRFREGGSEVYDAMGRLVRTVDPLGNETTLAYTNDLLTSIRDAGGRELTLSYYGALITSLSGPSGVIATYGYASGRLASVDYPDASGYTFAYDAEGQLLTVTDREQRVVEAHAYVDGKAVTSEISGGQERLDFVYEPGRTTTTDALGNTTTYEYAKFSGMSHLTKKTGPCSPCTAADVEEWTYTAEGRVETYKDRKGKITRYTYNGNGDVASEIDAYGSSLPRTVNYTYEYDAATGRITRRTRTAPGEGTTDETFGLAGPLTIAQSVTETETRTTTFTYYPNGKLWTVKDPADKTTTNTYFTTGDLETVTDPLTHVTHFTYDPMGRRLTVRDPMDHTTTTTYDARGRVRTVKDPENFVTEFTYDKSGLRTSVKDPLGRTTRSTYDRQGRLQTVVDAKSGVTRYAYDAMSRMISLTDAKGNVTRFEPDSYGRVKKVTYPGGAYETMTYDPVGRLKTKTDRKSVTTTYIYDDLGRLKQKTYSDSSPDVNFDYDSAGRLMLAQNAADTVNRTYDLAGQLRTETSTKNASTLSYEYFPTGSRNLLKLNGTTFLGYTYDDDSVLDTIARGTGVFDFGYDAAHRRGSLSYPNGTSTSYGYNDRSLLTSVGAAGVTQTGYAYDALGNRTTKTTPAFAEAYAYDALDRLTDVERTGMAKTWAYGYDKVGNRITEQVNQSASTASYNEKNQLTAQAAGGSLRFRGTLDEPGTVTVAGQAARMLPQNTFEADVAASAGTQQVPVTAQDGNANVRTNVYQVTVPALDNSFVYDANGNLTQKTDATGVWRYGWDVENRLIRVCLNADPCTDAAAVARFAYDALGRRVEKMAGATPTAYLYDGDDILQQTTGGVATRYIHGPGVDEPLAQTDASGTITGYFHADGLGSIVATTSAAGAVTASFRYDAYGNIEAGSPTTFAYTGREWDPQTGLYYYRARYYDPKIGRFISEDPIGFWGGINIYAYVNGDPVNSSDPTGLWSAEAHDALLQHAFAGRLPPRDVDALKMASRVFDKQTQSPSEAFKHSMRQSRQNPGLATRQRDRFIAKKLRQARAQAQAGNRDCAVRLLGQALHPIMDSSSPMHTDAQGNPGEWNSVEALKSVFTGGHSWSDRVGFETTRDISAEIYASQDQLLRDAYNQVFEY